MMPTGPTLAAAALAAIMALATAASTASAQSGAKDDGADAAAAKNDQFVTRLFAGPVGKEKSYACFVRTYDAAHLAQHKTQKVAAMKLLVTAEHVPEDESLNYAFRLGIKFRHRATKFETSGECGHAVATSEAANRTSIRCSVECDGGGIDIGLTNGDKSTMVTLERIMLGRSDRPNEEPSEEFNSDAEDHMFRLDRVSLKDCMSLVTDRKELAALQRK
jgi:hypothetical protein